MARTIVTDRDVAEIRASRQEQASSESARIGTPAGGAASTAGPAADVRKDRYTDRLVKYIPAEVIAFYVSLEGIVLAAATNQAGGPPVKPLRWAIFILVSVLTPLYLRRVGNIEKRKQIVVCTLAFIVWAATLPGTFFPWPHHVYAALLLPAFTFFVPMLQVEALPNEQVTGQ